MTTPYSPESTPDPGDTELRLLAIDYARGIVEEAVRRDIPRDPSVPKFEFMGVYVTESKPTPSIPVYHRKIILSPGPGKRPVNDIKHLIINAPTPFSFVPDEHSSEYNVHDEPRWKDLFLEIVWEWQSDRESYLLNNSGLIRYEDGDDLEKIEDSIMGDLFTVIGADTHYGSTIAGRRPPVDVRTLHRLLHYPLQRQD